MALTPFKLTAQTLRGVCVDEYSLDLAGVLSSRLWAAYKREHPMIDSNVERPMDFDLPFDMCMAGDDWHWMVSCGVTEVDERRPQEPRTYYRVVNDSVVARLAERPLPYYHPRSSAYRDVMMPAHITLSPTVTWYGVGDIDRIYQMVKDIRSIGKRRSKGEGRVIKWEIQEFSSADPMRFGHIGFGDRIIRPIPVECAEKLGLEYQLAWHAIRPPSWNPNRLRHLAINKEEEIYLPEEWEL